jgi:hypothetical protein
VSAFFMRERTGYPLEETIRIALSQDGIYLICHEHRDWSAKEENLKIPHQSKYRPWYSADRGTEVFVRQKGHINYRSINHRLIFRASQCTNIPNAAENCVDLLDERTGQVVYILAASPVGPIYLAYRPMETCTDGKILAIGSPYFNQHLDELIMVPHFGYKDFFVKRMGYKKL